MQQNTLTSIVKHCRNILRDNEGLSGDGTALRNITFLLILKLLEHQFGKEIDIDNYEYDFSHIEEGDIEQHKKKLFCGVGDRNMEQVADEQPRDQRTGYRPEANTLELKLADPISDTDCKKDRQFGMLRHIGRQPVHGASAKLKR